MENKDYIRLHRFRKKHDLVAIDVPKKDVTAIINMYLASRKGELNKDVKKYLNQQKR